MTIENGLRKIGNLFGQRGEEGSALVEFALTLPMLFGLIYLSASLTLGMYNLQQLRNATSATAMAVGERCRFVSGQRPVRLCQEHDACVASHLDGCEFHLHSHDHGHQRRYAHVHGKRDIVLVHHGAVDGAELPCDSDCDLHVRMARDSRDAILQRRDQNSGKFGFERISDTDVNGGKP